MYVYKTVCTSAGFGLRLGLVLVVEEPVDIGLHCPDDNDEDDDEEEEDDEEKEEEEGWGEELAEEG